MRNWTVALLLALILLSTTVGLRGEAMLASTKMTPMSLGAIGSLSWTTSSEDLPKVLNGAGEVIHKGRVYLTGGNSGTFATGSNDVYIGQLNAAGAITGWTPSTSLPEVRWGHHSVVMGSHLYVIGGYPLPNASAIVRRIAIQANGQLGSEWVALPEEQFPPALYRTAVVVNDNDIYVLGGYADNVPTNPRSDVFRAQVAEDGTLVIPAGQSTAWLVQNPLPKAMHAHSAAVLNGYLYVTGGLTTLSGGILSDVYAAQINTGGELGPWFLAGSLPTPLHAMETTAFRDHLLVIGGATGNPTLHQNTVYSVSTDETGALGAWELLTPLPEVRVGHTVVTNGDAILSFGGSSSVKIFEGRLIPAPFLDIPFVQGDVEGDPLQNHDVGRVTSWFDHSNPNYHNDGALTLFTDQIVLSEQQGVVNGHPCYSSSQVSPNYCYEGHDAIDFKPTVRGANELARAAATGQVVYILRGCQNTNSCPLLGNNVVVYHAQGYFTRYAHLDTVEVEVDVGDEVESGDTLGEMGATGTEAVHLHFAVYRDVDNNRVFDSSIDKVVDPYGYDWPDGPDSDPWVTEDGGPRSYQLWLARRTVREEFSGAEGTVLTNASNTGTVTIPPGYLTGSYTLQIEDSTPVAQPSASLRSVGRSFWVWLSQLLSPNTPAQVGIATDEAATVAVDYPSATLKHLDEAQIALLRWDESAEQWTSLPTEVDTPNNRLVAMTAEFGNFDVQAPLLCPQDVTEPDDDPLAAVTLAPQAQVAARLLDVSEDEDWFVFTANEGYEYALSASGAAAQLAVVAADAVTLLDSGEDNITWIAPADGDYYLRVTPPDPDEAGCSAAYTVSLAEDDTPNEAPDPPTNPGPADGHSLVGIAALLTWSATDPDNDLLSFQVSFGPTNPPPPVVPAQAATSYDPPGELSYNTTYYWQIVASDGAGGSTAGPVWSFTTLPHTVYLSPTAAGSLSGKAFTNADVLAYVKSTNTWDILYDGSAINITKNLGAFSFVGGELLLGFSAAQAIPGLGTAAPQDLLRFTPTSLGYNSTAGSFAWFFDGSDVGLTMAGEIIDALWIDATGKLYISTAGSGSVPVNSTQPAGAKIAFQDEDVLRFTPSSTGVTTVGTWALYWDPTKMTGMSAEDINGYWEDPATGHRYVTIAGAFTIGKTTYGQIKGDGKSIVRFAPNADAPGGWAPVEKVTWLAAGATLPAKFGIDGIEMAR